MLCAREQCAYRIWRDAERGPQFLVRHSGVAHHQQLRLARIHLRKHLPDALAFFLRRGCLLRVVGRVLNQRRDARFGFVLLAPFPRSSSAIARSKSIRSWAEC